MTNTTYEIARNNVLLNMDKNIEYKASELGGFVFGFYIDNHPFQPYSKQKLAFKIGAYLKKMGREGYLYQGCHFPNNDYSKRAIRYWKITEKGLKNKRELKREELC
ncbi:hypothetical protein ACOTWR_06645 [Aliarcobacter butzleri]